MTNLYSLESDFLEDLRGRLDHTYIGALAAQVRSDRYGSFIDQPFEVIEIAYMPGDMTHYRLVLVNLPEFPVHVVEGGGTGGQKAQSHFGSHDTLVVYAQEGKFTTFEWSAIEDEANDIAIRLTDNIAGQVALSELLRAIGGP